MQIGFIILVASFVLINDSIAKPKRYLFRFGSEWTFGSDRLLSTYPKNWVVVQTPYSLKKVREVRDIVERKLESEAAPRGTLLKKQFHSHWDREA